MGWKPAGSLLSILCLSFLILLREIPRCKGFVVTRRPTEPSKHRLAQKHLRQTEFACFSSSSRIEPASDSSDNDNGTGKRNRSCIRAIRSRNLGGVANHADIVISFPSDEQLITITGETGTGKSLLFARVLELIAGVGKTGLSSLVVPSSSNSETFAEVELELHEPWISAVNSMAQSALQDGESIFQHHSGILKLRRTLVRTGRGRRISSTCTINGQIVPLHRMTSLAAPLLKVVDAAAAASALVRPAARLAVLDTAVDAAVLYHVARHRTVYRDCQRERQRLERDIANLPYDPAQDSAEMLQHWIDELDAFETRVTKLCRSVATAESEEDAVDTKGTTSSIRNTLHDMAHVEWDANVILDEDERRPPSMHSCLLQLRNELRSLDEHMVATRNAINALSLVSVPNSAATALEQARNFLLDITTDNSEILEAAETSHEYLNRVEDALTSCTRFLEDDDKGLLQKLETNRANYPVSVEQLEEILFEWGTLARKHGIVQPDQLPVCHTSLRNEQDGGDQARARLPRLVAAETAALADLEASCAALHEERVRIASYLGEGVTKRLGALGMQDSVLRVEVVQARNATDALSSGYDTAQFLLETTTSDQHSTKRREQGEMSSVASSGEKARLLLAIECVLPGSVAAATTASANSQDATPDQNQSGEPMTTLPPPVAVLYDEIDAHVGGQAAVALSRMLRDQAEQSSQVFAITHSPPVAAVADLHVVVQKVAPSVCVKVLTPTERRQELARMASGNVAEEEALMFADALLREGVRNVTSV